MNTRHTLQALIYTAGLLIAVAGGFVAGHWTPQSAPAAAPAPAAPSAVEQTELKIDPSYLRAVGIATEQAAPGDLSVDVLAPGTIAPASNGVAVVTAHAAGAVVRIAKQLGDSVHAGETIGLVESRDAAAMAADRKVAETKANLARTALDREQELYGQRVTPRQDLERAQAELAMAQAELQRAQEAATAAHVTPDGRIAVISPLDGKITTVAAPLGTFVQADTELFRIADPRFVQVEAAVTAVDATRIAVGDAAKITLPAGAMLAAKVRSITPTVDQQTRTATVVLSLMPNHRALALGEVVSTDITPRNVSLNGVIVPEEAVQNVGGRNVVFVRTANGFRIRPVVVGARSGGRASIPSGLNAGETIATTNAFFLKAEIGKGAGDDE